MLGACTLCARELTRSGSTGCYDSSKDEEEATWEIRECVLIGISGRWPELLAGRIRRCCKRRSTLAIHAWTDADQRPLPEPRSADSNKARMNTCTSQHQISLYCLEWPGRARNPAQRIVPSKWKKKKKSNRIQPPLPLGPVLLPPCQHLPNRTSTARFTITRSKPFF
jgi:hypothetical protein